MSLDNMLTASASPHIRERTTVSGIMRDVIISLIPTLIAAIFIFGWRSLAVTAVTVGFCLLSEYVSRRVMKRPNTLGDLSAVVTGVILAFNLPVTIPLWMAAFGSVIAIVVVKQMFGGIGQNFVNPALLARIVLLVSFPSAMLSKWPSPFAWRDEAIDALTSATPLAALAQGSSADLPSLFEMLFVKSGSMGEACAFTLILGGIYLVAKKIISPIIPLCYIGTVGLFTLIYGAASSEIGDAFAYMVYHLLSGGLLLGAIFMATDYATSPISDKGKVIFAVGCGVLTFVIRIFGNMPEGVSFSIILMNILVPHIERLTTPVPFGTVKEKKQKPKEEKVSQPTVETSEKKEAVKS